MQGTHTSWFPCSTLQPDLLMVLHPIAALQSFPGPSLLGFPENKASGLWSPLWSGQSWTTYWEFYIRSGKQTSRWRLPASRCQARCRRPRCWIHSGFRDKSLYRYIVYRVEDRDLRVNIYISKLILPFI